MLDLSLDKVCFIVLKAREFHAKEEVVIPEEPSSPTDDWALQILADHRGDPSYQELKYLIDSMDEEDAEYIIGTPLIADYLEEGLSAFGYSCEEV
jgi:hypothetical protein